MGSKLRYTDNSITSIGVLWVFFTVCYVIICATAFFAPEWIGQEKVGTFGTIGLWSICTLEENGEICKGRLDNFMSFPGRAFQAATVFVGLALISSVLTMCVMVFFSCCHSSTVFYTCGWMQLFSGICMVAGCAIFPLGWNEEEVRRVCSNSDGYVLGHCDFRWGYLLALIVSLDSFILSILAFIQAMQPDDSTRVYDGGEMNHTFMGETVNVAGSRRSLNLRPIYLMQPGQEDSYSQFSQRTAPDSIRSTHFSHSHLPFSAHNFLS